MEGFKEFVIETYKKIPFKSWDTIYWAIDIHDTIVRSNYKVKEIPKEFLPNAKEVLQRLTLRTDTKLIMYTCSWPDEIEKYQEFFKSHGITFDYVNENPEAKNTAYGCYDKKPYCQILLDDKARFTPAHWVDIDAAIDVLETIPELITKHKTQKT